MFSQCHRVRYFIGAVNTPVSTPPKHTRRKAGREEVVIF
jgi:hypothetical protein